LVNALSQSGVLTSLAKLRSPPAVGTFALGLPIAAPVTAIGTMQLRAIQVTDRKGEYAFKHYWGTGLLTTALGILVVAGIASVGGSSVQAALMIKAREEPSSPQLASCRSADRASCRRLTAKLLQLGPVMGLLLIASLVLLAGAAVAAIVVSCVVLPCYFLAMRWLVNKRRWTGRVAVEA